MIILSNSITLEDNSETNQVMAQLSFSEKMDGTGWSMSLSLVPAKDVDGTKVPEPLSAKRIVGSSSKNDADIELIAGEILSKIQELVNLKGL